MGCKRPNLLDRPMGFLLRRTLTQFKLRGMEDRMSGLFNEMVWRPWAALASSMKMFAEQVSSTMRFDALLSRTTHVLNRPFAIQDQPAPTRSQATNHSSEHIDGLPAGSGRGGDRHEKREKPCHL